MIKLQLNSNLDLRIGKHISIVIDDDGITINDFSEKSELWINCKIDGSLETQTIKQIRTIYFNFKEDKE